MLADEDARSMSLPHRSAVVAWMTYAIALLVAMILSPRLVADLASLSPGLLPLAGAIAAFIGCVAWLQRLMGLALARPHFGEPEGLVTSGPFAVTRNPIYLAFVLPLASLALYAPAAALLGIVLYVGVMNRFVIGPEERALEAAFGPRYHAWAQRTPRWIGLPRQGIAAREN